MRFVETPIFTREVCNLLEDKEYRALQLALLFRPEQGGFDSRQEDLTPAQLKKLSKLVKEEFK